MMAKPAEDQVRAGPNDPCTCGRGEMLSGMTAVYGS